MWEWRAFAERLDLASLVEDDAQGEARTDIYVAGPGVGAARGLKLRDARTLELKLRVEVDLEDPALER